MRIFNIVGFQFQDKDGITYGTVFTLQGLFQSDQANTPTYGVYRDTAKSVQEVLEKHGPGVYECSVQTNILGGKNYDSIVAVKFSRPFEASDFPMLRQAGTGSSRTNKETKT